MTPEEKKAYKHNYYLKNRDSILKWTYDHRKELSASRTKWRSKHREEQRTYERQYKRNHPEQSKESDRKSNYKLRMETLSHYGNKCAFCGDKNPNHLTIDHINNDGAEHRRKFRINNIYRWLRDNNYPEGFQILCWNHNAEKQFYKTMTPVETC